MFSLKSIFQTLSPLQDNVPPVEFERIEKVIKEEFPNYNEIYKSIDPVPLASASLGQTHKAFLHDGREVVLKILKPDIEKIIDTDFAILTQVFKLMNNFKVFQEHADFFQILDEFIRVSGDELNFIREAHICKELKRNLIDLDYLIIPHIYEEYSTRRIIVMEYQGGDRISMVQDWSPAQ